MPQSICEVADCDAPVRSRQMCALHYDRYIRSTPPSQRPPLTFTVRFARRTEADPETGCLLWLGALDSRGYGRVGVPGRGTAFAHRVALEHKLGRPLNHGAEACHGCDNPRCVNPEHLYEGSRQQNVDDCTRQLRHAWGERNAHHKLTADDVRTIRARVLAGERVGDVATAFGIHQSTVSKVARRLSWRLLS